MYKITDFQSRITIFFKYILNSLIFDSGYLLDINNQAKLIDV